MVASPKLAQELHPTLNDHLKADELSSSSSLQVWWLGECGHSWLQQVRLRVSRGYGCTICKGKVVLQGFNDLGSLFPELAKQWDFEQNSISPNEVTAGSGSKYFWKCQKGHSYPAPVVERVRQLKRGRKTSCPFCINRKLAPGQNDFAAKHPELIAEWDFSKNRIDPSQIPPGYKGRVWWNCPQGHAYDLSPYIRTSGKQKCPVCSGKRVVAGINDFATAHPELAKSWDVESNAADSSPANITSNSGKKFWWLCDLGHSFQARVAHRTNGRGCPYCAGKKVLPGFNDLLTKRPEIARMWSESNGIRPNFVLNGSNRRFMWMCELGHEWEAAPIWVKGCPICANQVLLRGFNDLLTVYPATAEQWNQARNGELKPEDVIAGSAKYVWWICAQGHEWKTSPNNRLRTGCPRCSQGGYDQSKPGIIYFLRNHELASRKVGITNTDSDRLERLRRNGWVVIAQWTSQDGQIPLNVETEVLRWLRKGLGLPPFLTASQMTNTGGWSETFSDFEPADHVVIEIIEKLILDRAEP